MDATVSNRTDLSKRLREVCGLHAFAELFGFSWEDGSDWTWHDVACAMADAVDAAMAGKDIERYDELDWCPFGMSGVARCEADKALKAENARLREENKRLRARIVSCYTEQLLHSDDVLGEIMAEKKLKELGEAENV